MRLNKYGTDLDAVAGAVHAGSPDTETVTFECCRCSGTGTIPHFGHVREGVCFECGGSPSTARYTLTVGELRAKARRDATARDRKAARAAAKATVIDEWKAANEDIVTYLRPHIEAWGGSAFLRGLAEQVFSHGRPLTAEQVAAVRAGIARDAEKAAAKAATPELAEGKLDIEGLIVGVKNVEDTYGYASRWVTKMTVDLGDGTRVYGTMPAKLVDAGAGRGDTVRFAATITRSRGDHTFGFFKAPSRASVLDSAH